MMAAIDIEYEAIRVRRRGQQDNRNLAPIAEARKNPFSWDWDNYQPPEPVQKGIQIFDDYPLAEIARRIDWTPFFSSWQLKGKFPKILDDEVVGKEATKLYRDAKRMLKKIIDEKWLTAKAVIGFWQANSQRSEEHTSELQSRPHLVCRLLLEKKNKKKK